MKMCEAVCRCFKNCFRFNKMQYDFNDILVNKNCHLTPGIYYPKNANPHKVRKKGSRIQTERAIFKNGEMNVENPKPEKNLGILSKWFITMVEARWRWTLVNFFTAFTSEWLFFAVLYWIIVRSHGDLKPENNPMYNNTTTWIPCIENIHSFTSTFLFSIEVHTTVAYGRRSITLECPQAITAMCLQCILSSVFQAFMVGILFAKLTRPKSRTATILFSRNAVVNFDEKLCLSFRVGDVRTSRILNIKALAFFIRFDDVKEELVQTEMKVQIQDAESFFFLWPVTVTHVIDETSPLHNMSAADLLCDKIEVLVVFEGVIESTGQPIQARSSFTENEILWGYRFKPMVKYNCRKKMYDVDFSKLSETYHEDAPLCSASELDSVIGSASGVSQSSFRFSDLD